MKKNIKLILISSVIAAFAFASSGCFTTMAIIARTAEAVDEGSSTFEFHYGNADWDDLFGEGSDDKDDDKDTEDGKDDYEFHYEYNYDDPDEFEDALESLIDEYKDAFGYDGSYATDKDTDDGLDKQ